MTAHVAHFTPAQQIQKRLKAALIHASISVAIFVPLAYLVLFHWYPGIYFESDGGWRGMILIFCVDVVLGPALTFIIFTPGKALKKIYFDLGLIALVQLGALIWGIYAVHSQRPVAVILSEGAFRPVVGATYDLQGVTSSELNAFSASRPPTIFSRPPANKEEMASVFLETLNNDLAMFHFVPMYAPLADNLDALEHANLGWDQVVAAEPQLLGKLEKMRAGAPAQSILLVPFRGRYADAILVFAPDAEYLGGVIPTGSY